MFGARKKGKKQQYTPPTAASVNPGAATAAVSAYNLSSAAAAAALKALPTPPTNVAAVQTKRTMRRSSSVSSEGSRRPLSPVPSIKRVMGLGGGKDTREGVVVSPTGAPTLRRRGSSSSIKSMSSMTERTFRSPSPHGSRTAALAAAAALPNGSVNSKQNMSMNAAGTAAAMAAGRSQAAAGGSEGGGFSSRSRSVPPPPPVPVIPKHVIESQPKQQTLKQQKRATTLGFVQQPLRLASQKQKEGRSSWFRSGTVGDIDSVRTSDVAMDINGYAQQPERPGSRSSLQNFSYPSRQRLGSPPPSPTITRASMAAAPAAAVAASLPPVKNLTRSASTERAPTQPPASQPKAVAATRRSASTSRVMGRSHAAPDMTLVYDPNSRRMVPRAELLMMEQSILDASEKPQKQQRKKKQQQGTTNASLAGAHLAQGTMTHAHGSAAPLNRSEVQRVAKDPQPQSQQQNAPKTSQVQAPEAPRSPTPERQLPKISTAVVEPQEPTQQDTDDRDLEEPPQPLPALSTSASTPSSSVSSLAALAASQMATSPVAIQNASSPEDAGFEGTLLTEDGRPVLAKRPSIVREEPDLEEEEEQQQETRKRPLREDSQTKLSTAAAVVAAAGSRTARDDLDGVSAKHATHHNGHAAPQEEQQAPAAAPKEQERTRSISPVRTARFSPIVGSNLTVRRHSPPPRSISPRKSALKHSGPRDASPSDSASEANPSLAAGDLALNNRKKAHRVSFDDKAVVVTQSPLPPSPPHSPGLSSLPGASEAPQNSHTAHQPPTRSRSWFSNIGRSKKKGDNSTASGDDDDLVMKPRPALPSFGSVRDKSHPAQQEERPLVRPATENQSTNRQSSQPLESHSTSSDHAIGFIVGAERQTSPNTANTSRYREPLPPVVTSVDGNGYVSDSADSSNSDDEADVDNVEHSPVLRFDEEQETTVPAALDEPIMPSAPMSNDTDEIIIVPGLSSPTKSPKNTVPAIAISHPSQENLTAVRGTGADEEDEDEDDVFDEPETVGTPTVAAVAAAPVVKSSPVRSSFDVPGTFPLDSESDGTAKGSPTHASFVDASNQPVPTRQNAFEPITQDDDHSYSPQMPATVFATHMPTLHEESSLRNEPMFDDDSDSEVFSDAYEDLSDIEGDGFLSLDAVVDSPIVPDLAKSPFAASSLTGSPSRKSDAPQLGPSPLAKELAPAALTNGSLKSAADTTVLPAVAAGGAMIGMAALATTAMNKQRNGGPPADSENEEDWEKIKAFWRGLTTEKRAQLEKEAKEEAAMEGDLEDESAAADKKPRRKKSVEKRIAEKKAIQEMTPARQEAAAPAVVHQSQKPAATRIRRSMRDNAPGANAGGSGSQTPPYPITLQKERMASAFPPKAAKGAVMRPAPPPMHSRTLSADSASSAQGKSNVASLLPSALRRRGSDSSESSFKRFRSNSTGAATGGAAGVSSFRTSMRGDAKTKAAPTNGTSNGNINHRSSRFSLRSLSPTGSTTMRGSTESSPAQFRRSMRDGAGTSGFSSMEAKRMSSPGVMASSTLRKSAAADSGGGFFSLGKKRGSKLLQRNKDQGGSGNSGLGRFDSSDEEDDDIFGPGRASNGAASAAYRRSASAGGAFRSRFVDSSDEDEAILSTRTVGARKNNKDHVVPKTLRTGRSMRSASARPASSSTPLSPPLPEELEEDEEVDRLTAGLSAFSGVNGGIGTSTLRRSRSGRGQIAPASPMYSPTTTGAVGLDSMATPTRRSSGIMSVLRRKKNDGPLSPTSISNGASGNKIQRAALVDSAARRDTPLERSSHELAAVRSNSRGSQGRRAMNGDVDSDDDLDSDDGRVQATDSWPLPGPSTNGVQTQVSASTITTNSPDKKKKKFPGLRRMFRLDD
ncbi:hypothetical protein SBRCBS47491_000296 [Sporothrix bragantina]|uniref:Uncharacterized protein n=1 Tax=Sporothrix bragantina TaxID=671064 RepID=A0ABP0AP63_9PEZI